MDAEIAPPLRQGPRHGALLLEALADGLGELADRPRTILQAALPKVGVEFGDVFDLRHGRSPSPL